MRLDFLCLISLVSSFAKEETRETRRKEKKEERLPRRPQIRQYRICWFEEVGYTVSVRCKKQCCSDIVFCQISLVGVENRIYENFYGKRCDALNRE